jgi:hypothetical protein
MESYAFILWQVEYLIHSNEHDPLSNLADYPKIEHSMHSSKYEGRKKIQNQLKINHTLRGASATSAIRT